MAVHTGTEKVALTKTQSMLYESYRDVRKQWMEISKLVRNRDSFMNHHSEPKKTPENRG